MPFTRLAGFLFVFLLLTHAAQASPVLDQSYEPVVNGAASVYVDVDWAQTFTVGPAGILTGVEVLIFDNGPVDEPTAP